MKSTRSFLCARSARTRWARPGAEARGRFGRWLSGFTLRADYQAGESWGGEEARQSQACRVASARAPSQGALTPDASRITLLPRARRRLPVVVLLVGEPLTRGDSERRRLCERGIQ